MQDIEQIYKEHFEVVNKYLFCLTYSNDIAEDKKYSKKCKKK